MRSLSLLLLLPAITAAQTQKPLMEQVQEQLSSLQDQAQGWFEKAKSYIPSSSPIDAGAAKVAQKNVHMFTVENWLSYLSPSTSDPSKGPEEWMVLVSGGNKSCFGNCVEVERAWNVRSSSPCRLGD